MHLFSWRFFWGTGYLVLMKKSQLSKTLSQIPMEPFYASSRIHPLRSFGPQCYVKREDELSFGVSGTKLRKYLSFLPEMVKSHPDEAIIIGSVYSNHVVSMAQLLREKGITPILFFIGRPDSALKGNLLYSALFVGSEHIHWIPKEESPRVENYVEEYIAKNKDKRIVVIPKGANTAAALPGSLTLALDILRNEEEHKLSFDHVLLDSGTGLTACALLLAFAFLGRKTFFHIVQIAGTKEEFHALLAQRKEDFERLLQISLPMPVDFELYTPSTSPSFGSVNSTVFQTIRDIARQEGFFTDPVFTAKLFYEGRKILSQRSLQGNILFIHSGGGLALTGFQEEMARFIQ